MNAHLGKTVCIMNPAAGTRKAVRQGVERVLHGADVDFTFCETQAAGHGFQLAQEAIEAQAQCVVGIGGDGTLNEIARALVDTDVAFGMIPVGSGNAFARALNISTSPQRACEQLLAAQATRLDVGTVEDEIFLSTAGVGADAEVAWQYGKRQGKRRGLIPYVKLTLQVLRQYHPQPVTLILDETQELSFCPLIVAVANTAQYGNGVVIAPGALANDGVLDVRVIESLGTLSLARQGMGLVRGAIDKMPGVHAFQAKTIRIEREAQGHYQFDGEALLGQAQLNFGIREKALSVLVPNG